MATLSLSLSLSLSVVLREGLSARERDRLTMSQRFHLRKSQLQVREQQKDTTPPNTRTHTVTIHTVYTSLCTVYSITIYSICTCI